ncbi:hypothetical protein QBB34_29395 [Streptomyces stelliscabiei]
MLASYDNNQAGQLAAAGDTLAKQQSSTCCTSWSEVAPDESTASSASCC